MAHALNPAQRAAVDHEHGPLLVLAGAGSGKTRVIVHRIARLVDTGTRPEAILAVTFTNKAADEMRQRVSKMVGARSAEALWLSTFHSFGLRFLKKEAPALGYPKRFAIFDQGDSLGLVRELLRRRGTTDRGSGDRRLDASAILTRISLWRSALVQTPKVADDAEEYDGVAAELFGDYEAALRAMHAFDFDDLVIAPLKILQQSESIRTKWQGRFRHLLIDEFQDTNRAQLALVQELTNSLGNVCVVGDDDQSIYAFRGADVGNIHDFEQRFAGTRVVKLEENYRSRSPILNVANSAIEQDKNRRYLKKLVARRGGGEAVRLCAFVDTGEEARFVASELRDLRAKGVRLSEAAVLYRSNQQARLIEEELRVEGLPYRLFGGTQFFDRKEVKDAAAYLRLLIYPRDELSLRRVINQPTRGVGLTALRHLEKHALRKELPLLQVALESEGIAELSSSARAGLRSFGGAVAEARAALGRGEPVGSTARAYLDSVGLLRALAEPNQPGGARRLESVQFLLNSLERYASQVDRSQASKGQDVLAKFLERFYLRRDDSSDAEKADSITLATLHASKGLEFDAVFLIGCVEGQLPHRRTTDPKVTEAVPADIAEERRLFYVGVTRAKDLLYITHPKQRVMRGRATPLAPSRFLDGLPEADLVPYERPEAEALDTDELAKMSEALLAQLSG